MTRRFRRAEATLLALAAGVVCSSAQSALGATLPIKKIAADASQQLVVEFGGGGFPTVPQVLDLPGPNHRVVIDFADASLDPASVSTADRVTAAVKQSAPFVKAVRFSNLENAPKPTARVVVDLPEEVKVKPRVVKLEEGLVVIGFSDQPIAAGAQQQKAQEESPGWDWSTGDSQPSQSAPQPQSAALRPPVTQAAAPVQPVSSPRPAVAGLPAGAARVGAAASPAAAIASQAGLASQVAGASPAARTAAPAVAATASAPIDKQEAVKRYNRAVQLHLSGKLDEAIAAYKSALETNHGLAEAHSNLGLIYNQQHNYAQALAEFRKALAINPKDAITYNGIGAALRAEKDLLGAIKNWQTAVSLDPKLATAHYNLGTAYEIQKEFDKAISAYRAAVKNDYRLGEAYYRMGLIMERRRKSEDAIDHFKEALKVSGQSEYSEDARQRISYLESLKKGKAQ